MSKKSILALSGRIIAFHVVLAKIGGSIEAGLFLSQALYWSSKTRDPNGWFYKTHKEWYEEILMKRRQLDNVIKRWKELGVLETQRRGLPAKLYFKINFDRLEELLENYDSNEENDDDDNDGDIYENDDDDNDGDIYENNNLEVSKRTQTSYADNPIDGTPRTTDGTPRTTDSTPRTIDSTPRTIINKHNITQEITHKNTQEITHKKECVCSNCATEKPDLVDGMLHYARMAQEKKQLWRFRDKIPEPLLVYLDEFYRLTGIEPLRKSDIGVWIEEAGIWQQNNVSLEDIKVAVDRSKGKFILTSPASLTKTVCAIAQGKRVKPYDENVDPRTRDILAFLRANGANV